MMFGVPIMQLVLFGFAINNDPKALPTAILSSDQSSITRAMIQAIEQHQLFFGHPSGGKRGGSG